MSLPFEYNPTGGEILDRVQFVGVMQDRPMFEFQAMLPPHWMVAGIKAGKIPVVDGKAYIGGRLLSSGDVLTELDFL